MFNDPMLPVANSLMNLVPEERQVLGIRQWWVNGYFGKGVRVAMLDSPLTVGPGYNPPDASHERYFGVAKHPLSYNTKLNTFSGSISHGRQVAGRLLPVAPSISLYVVPYYTVNANVDNRRDVLWRSINWCIENNIQIITASTAGRDDPELVH